MRIAVAGSGRLGATVMRPLLQSSHQVVAVVQDGRQTRGLKRILARISGRIFGGADNMLKLAAVNRLPVVYINKMSPEELAPLKALNIDVLLVSGFAIILKKPILELPRVGCVNMHSSLLPRHRGPNPFSAAIVQGDTQSGVTFHVMEEGIDTGVILDQTPFEIEASDDMMTVYRKACAIAGERICAVMDQVARDGLRGAEQDPALATYDGKPTDADAQVDWSRPAAEIDRLVRGLTPAKMPRFPYRGSQIFIAKSRFSSEAVDAAPGTVLKNGNPPRIATGQGWIDLQVAFCRRPFPWIWPSPFNRPRVGERLDP